MIGAPDIHQLAHIIIIISDALVPISDAQVQGHLVIVLIKINHIT